MASTNLIAARELMVNNQLIRRGIQNPTVLNAMRNIPRHRFVDKKHQIFAYEDHPVPIGYDQTISQPYIVAYMTELLQVEQQHRVLEIGTGCGYQTAVLASLATEVISLEIIPELVEKSRQILTELGYTNIDIHRGNGRLGWPAEAPFDRILVTAAARKIPSQLTEQLAPGGRMVAPVGSSLFCQNLEIFRKDENGNLTTRRSLGVRFVPLVEK